MVQIDAHQHFWNPARGDYDWMPKDNPTLARPYAPADLAPHLTEHGIDATVLVQAAATVEETEYMLGLADATPWIAGVVGWVDFEQSSHFGHLRRLAKHPKFLGVRPMIQDIPDPDWMLRDDVQWGFKALCDLGLTFDALGFPKHLANFHTLLNRFPEMMVVIDHCMKPQIHEQSEHHFRFWADGIARLAERSGTVCKYSALVTEDIDAWTIERLRPYSDHVFSVFGPDRTMWGSDWPVCRLSTEYSGWRRAAEELTAHLDIDARARIFGETAVEFYGLST